MRVALIGAGDPSVSAEWNGISLLDDFQFSDGSSRRVAWLSLGVTATATATVTVTATGVCEVIVVAVERVAGLGTNAYVPLSGGLDGGTTSQPDSGAASAFYGFQAGLFLVETSSAPSGTWDAPFTGTQDDNAEWFPGAFAGGYVGFLVAGPGTIQATMTVSPLPDGWLGGWVSYE